MFSCEYWKNFKNACFEEHLQTAASVGYFFKKIIILYRHLCVASTTD